jgi:predicted nuclease of predicted toxin-antitoxin system
MPRCRSLGHAKTGGFAIVTADADFFELAANFWTTAKSDLAAWVRLSDCGCRTVDPQPSNSGR